MTVIDQLVVQFSADFKELSRELNKAQGETSRAMKGMERSLAPISAAFRAMGPIVAATGAVLSVDFAKQALDAAGGIGELAEQLGTSTDMLQVYQFAAAQAGVKSTELETALAKLSQNIGDAAQGGDQAVAAFNRLGVGVLDASGKTRSMDAILSDVAEQIAAIEDPTKRAAAAVDLFGRSGQRLLPILSQGAAGIATMQQAAREAGAVLDQDMIRAADEASDKIAAMESSLAKMAQTIMATVAPAISNLSDQIRKTFGGTTRLEELADIERKIANFPRQQRGGAGNKQLQGYIAERDRIRNAMEFDAIAAAQGRGGNALGAPGGTSNPVGTAGAKKAADEALRAAEKAAKESADRIQAINETVAQSLIDTYTNVGKFLDEQTSERSKALEAEMKAVSEGVQNLTQATVDAQTKAYEENQRAIERSREEFREYADIVGEGFQDMILNARKFDDVLKGLAARFGSKILGKATDSLFSNVFGSLFGKAGGGAISGPTLVGERGPEIFNPGGAGTILPMSRVGGGGVTNNYIDARGADPSVLPRLQLMLDQTRRQAVAESVATVRTRNFREPAFLNR